MNEFYDGYILAKKNKNGSLDILFRVDTAAQLRRRLEDDEDSIPPGEYVSLKLHTTITVRKEAHVIKSNKVPLSPERLKKKREEEERWEKRRAEYHEQLRRDISNPDGRQQL